MNLREFKRGDIAAVLLILFLGFAAAYAAYKGSSSPKNPNGFGPEWECVDPGYGQPVCHKRVVKPDAG
jgi:hypothetical protein